MSSVRIREAAPAERANAVLPMRPRAGRADRMLHVLKDGAWHSREEILALSPGPYFLTNNAASDLRKRGLVVEYELRRGLRCYRLVGGGVLDDAGTSEPDGDSGAPLAMQAHTSGLVPASSSASPTPASPLLDASPGGALQLTFMEVTW